MLLASTKSPEGLQSSSLCMTQVSVCHDDTETVDLPSEKFSPYRVIRRIQVVSSRFVPFRCLHFLVRPATTVVSGHLLLQVSDG